MRPNRVIGSTRSYHSKNGPKPSRELKPPPRSVLNSCASQRLSSSSNALSTHLFLVRFPCFSAHFYFYFCKKLVRCSLPSPHQKKLDPVGGPETQMPQAEVEPDRARLLQLRGRARALVLQHSTVQYSTYYILSRRSSSSILYLVVWCDHCTVSISTTLLKLFSSPTPTITPLRSLHCTKITQTNIDICSIRRASNVG